MSAMPDPWRVIVLDDDPQARRLIAHEFEHVHRAAQVVDVIDQAQFDTHISSGDFDIVVTEFQLGWSDGIRVLKAVKASFPDCPVIMFTAAGSEEVAVAAMKWGLDEYVIKSADSAGRLRGAILAWENVPLSKQEKSLLSRLDDLLSHLQMGAFVCTTDGRFVEASSTLRDLFGMQIQTNDVLPSLFADPVQGQTFLQDVLVSSERRQVTFAASDATTAETRFIRVTARLMAAQGRATLIEGLVEYVTQLQREEGDAQLGSSAKARVASLSPREHEVMQQVVAGLPNKAIARKLGISEKTVEKHRASLMKKMRVRSIAELVRLALAARDSAG